MGFGVGDLFSIIGGGAWLAKEAVGEICERQDNLANAELIEAFVSEHTDSELEERLRAEILTVSSYEEIWSELEQYKRDNPVWCKMHEKTGWQGQYTGKYYEPVFGWQDVGKKRLPFFDDKGTVRGKNQQEESILSSNRNIVLQMLLETHGKMRRDIARVEAQKKYPLPKSNRSW